MHVQRALVLFALLLPTSGFAKTQYVESNVLRLDHDVTVTSSKPSCRKDLGERIEAAQKQIEEAAVAGLVVGGVPGAVVGGVRVGFQYAVSEIADNLQEAHGIVLPGQARYASCGLVNALVPRGAKDYNVEYFIRNHVPNGPWQKVNPDCWDCGPDGFYVMHVPQRTPIDVLFVYEDGKFTQKKIEPSYSYLGTVRNWQAGSVREFKIRITYDVD